MSGAWCWFPKDVFNILAAIVAARKPLTDDEKQIIIAVAIGFGLQVYFDGDEFKPR